MNTSGARLLNATSHGTLTTLQGKWHHTLLYSALGSKESYLSAARTVIGIPVMRGSCKNTDSDSGSLVWGGVCMSNNLRAVAAAGSRDLNGPPDSTALPFSQGSCTFCALVNVFNHIQSDKKYCN